MLRMALAALLLALAVPGSGAPATAAGGTLAVDAAADNHPISPLIYGMSNADPVLAAQVGLPLNRYGGNLADTYNWQADMENTGNDYFFESLPGCWGPSDNWCSNPPADPSTRYRSWVADDQATGTDTLLVLPTMGRVTAGPPTYAHPFVCAFTQTGQDAYDPYQTNCGNGQQGGSYLAPNVQDSIAAPPSWNGAWVNDIVSNFGTAANGGVRYYGLGNEPALWNSTHHDMHPAPETYDELWQTTRDNALQVRAADPTAKILAFSEWGWPNYFCSAADNISQGCSADSPDRAAHGGTPIVEWLLQQAQQYETDHGVRLFDYLDVHYYPQGGSPPDNLRSLYDPTYTDPSWIDDQIDLIPRMHQWVADDYPGTKISISEWDWGHNGDLLGAVTDAEVLGIFAREQVDLAAKWAPPTAAQTAAAAWRMYLDYDGAHSQFGSTWIRSTSTVAGLQVFGAKRPDGTLTVLVANDSGNALKAPLTIASASPAFAQVWQLSSATKGAIVRQTDQAVSAGGVTTSYPGHSLTLLVLPAGGPRVTGFKPANGKAGTTVTVTGSGFAGATAVSFGGTAATFTVVSGSKLTAHVPAGAHTGPVAVTTPGGTESSVAAFKVKS